MADLQQIRSTFQTTDLGQTEKKPALVEDALAQEIEEGLDESEDEEYDPNMAVWDENENLCEQAAVSEEDVEEDDVEPSKDPTVKSVVSSIKADEILQRPDFDMKALKAKRKK